MDCTSLDIQIPPEKVLQVGFGSPSIFSGGVWMSRAWRIGPQDLFVSG